MPKKPTQKKPTQKKPTQKKPTQKKPTQWKVYRLKGSPAAFIGTVYAPDEKAALKAAIKEFEITPDQQNRLLIRRA